jgi:hypothetical protein
MEKNAIGAKKREKGYYAGQGHSRMWKDKREKKR